MREAALSSRVPGTVTPKDKVHASAIGGGFAGGATAALFRTLVLYSDGLTLAHSK